MSNLNKECNCKQFFGCVCGQEVPQNVIKIVEAFGGIHNINGFNNSVSELRYDLKNVNLVNVDELKKLGAKKVVILESSKHVQAEFGEIVQELNFEVKKYSNLLRTIVSEEIKSASTNTKNNTKEVQAETNKSVLAPVSGKVISFAELNDGIFSENLVGNGVAILLNDKNSTSKVIAPFDGRITMLPASKNQFIFRSNSGVELVILLGQNSFKLDGLGIESRVKLNEEVKAGDTLFDLDLKRFTTENIDKHIVISTTNFSSLKNIKDRSTEAIQGQKLFELN